MQGKWKMFSFDKCAYKILRDSIVSWKQLILVELPNFRVWDVASDLVFFFCLFFMAITSGLDRDMKLAIIGHFWKDQPFYSLSLYVQRLLRGSAFRTVKMSPDQRVDTTLHYGEFYLETNVQYIPSTWLCGEIFYLDEWWFDTLFSF